MKTAAGEEVKREFSQWAEALTKSRNLENFVAPSELQGFLGCGLQSRLLPPKEVGRMKGKGIPKQRIKVWTAERLKNRGPGLAGCQQRANGLSEPIGDGAPQHFHAPRKGKMCLRKARWWPRSPPVGQLGLLRDSNLSEHPQVCPAPKQK